MNFRVLTWLRRIPFRRGRVLVRLCLPPWLAWLAVTAGAEQWRLFQAGDGLSESLSTTVTVNPRGFLCVKHGTVSAISLLDGYGVQNLPAPAERIHRVYQNRAGRIWAASDDGLLSHAGSGWTRYPLTNQLTVAELNQLRAGRSPTLFAAQEDRVLMVLPERLVQFRAADGTLVTLREARGSPLERFTDMTPSAGGSLWLSGVRGVSQLQVPVRQLEPGSGWTDTIVPAELAVTDLLRPVEDDEGGVTVIGEAASGRRVLAHLEGGRWRVRGLPDESLRFAWRDMTPDAFWGVTLNRLVRFEGEEVVTVTPPVAVSLVYDVAVQARGVFWLATREGVLRHAPSAWRPPKLPVSAPGLVAGFAEDAAAGLWCVAETGLLHAESNTWSRVPWPGNVAPGFGVRDGMFVLPDGSVLISTSDMLWRHRPGAGPVEPVSHPTGRVVRLLRREPEGTCLVAVRIGAGTSETNTVEAFDGERFRPWNQGPAPPQQAGELFFLERGRGGDWWLGANAGPAWWREGRWQFFGAADGYADDGALCWLEMPDGRIWCAGLGRIHEFDGRRWTAVRRGLDRVNAMLRASDGSVWVAANNGLHRFHRGIWLAIGAVEGLPSVATHSVFETSRREVWIGTLRGPVTYVPHADLDAPRTQTIAWEQLPDAGGENTGLLTLGGQDRWRFTPDDRLVFSYRLDGREWSEPVPPGPARLRRLTQGRHEVEVRAMDRNWNEEIRPQSLAFRVSVPWHRDRRVVVVGLMGFLAALAAGAVAVNRHLQLRRSYADVERQVEERTRQLRRATDALAQGQKMTALGTLAAGIAHDFNNILSIIKGSAQIIAANPQDREKVLTRVSRILTMVDQASDVVRALLGFGTATERTVKACDVNEIVGRTVRLLSDRFRRDITVELELAEGLPPVLAAADLLQQSLLNLIFNAADAIEDAGHIVVATVPAIAPPEAPVLAPAPARAYVGVEVRDAGSGIPPEVLPRIFDPFFTTKALTPRPGRGLGLYMVYEFAKETGHGIAVESRPGQGSTFRLILPVAAPNTLNPGDGSTRASLP